MCKKCISLIIIIVYFSRYYQLTYLNECDHCVNVITDDDDDGDYQIWCVLITHSVVYCDRSCLKHRENNIIVKTATAHKINNCEC